MLQDDDELAKRAFDCIASMREARSADDLSATASLVFEDLGLPHFALARFFRADGTSDVSILMGTFQPDWAKRYIDSGYAGQSQIVREVLRTDRPYSWGDVVARGVDNQQKRIKDEAGDFGLDDGLFTPIRWHDGSYAAVALAGSKPQLDDRFVRTSASVVSGYFAVESRRLACGPGKIAPLLSARQRECLAWVRQGKSSGVIGDILGLSVRTVDEHLAEACRKLGVRTRVQAAVQATLRGLID
jgi:DNA-binding CsgD family transcriptional regulator